MGLQENIRAEPISDLLLRQAVTAPPQRPVRQVVATMRRVTLGAVIVVDEQGLPLGMFNEKLLIRMLADDPSALDQPVGDHMCQLPVTVRSDASIAKLINTMQAHKLRWICVVDAEGRPTNLTGLRGVMEYLIDYFPNSVKVQPMDEHFTIETREGA
ncbi:MAG: CBS domain-containing protein [Phycisphaerae bacterium]|nr:CBS domain-containing protein [Phycisphaerae bacterium]